jgi:hypothetical protein
LDFAGLGQFFLPDVVLVGDARAISVSRGGRRHILARLDLLAPIHTLARW